MLKAIGKFIIGIVGIGVGLFTAVAAVGLAGDGMGDILGGGASGEEKNAGFRKAGS
jgi:hypothetical protein